MTTETLFDLKDRLNWQQACTVLGCGKTKLYALINSGALPVHRVGKRGMFISRQSCIALLNRAVISGMDDINTQ